MALQLRKRERLPDIIVGGASRPAQQILVGGRPVPSRAPMVSANTVQANTAANRSFWNKLINFGPLAAKDTARMVRDDPGFLVDVAVETAREIAAKPVVRLANTLPEKVDHPLVNALRKPPGFDRRIEKGRPVVTPNNRITKALWGDLEISNVQQDAKDMAAALDDAKLPGWAVLPAGLAINSPLRPKVGKPKALPKVTAKAKPGPDDAAFRAAQAKRQAQYSQGTISKAKRAIGRNLWDPRNVEQRLDNAEFKRLKAAGKTKKGQAELLPEQSLAVQRGRIQNPHRAAEVRNKKRYATEQGDFSINDIIKHYGKEDGGRARDFENYRIYKDELERLGKGHDNTIGVDPKAMSEYVAAYEATNPLAIAHNKALRQASLEALREKRAARIDNPELYDIARTLEHYNPRDAIDPEDLIRPKMSGGVRSGAKTTQRRAKTSGGPVRSPLSVFRKQNAELERSLAEQRYGHILKERVRAGTVKNAKETVKAETVILHKQILKEAEALRVALGEAHKLKKSLKKATSGAKASARGASKKAKAAEDKVVNTMRGLLNKAKGDRQNVYSDLVDRDARYGAELAALKEDYALNRKTNLTPEERQAQFKYDKAQLDKKYPKPEAYTRKELLAIAEAVGEPSASTRQAAVKLSDRLKTKVEELNETLMTARENTKLLDAQRRQNWGEGMATAQRTERGTQEVIYKLDGETGRMEIPADLAESLSKQNELMNRALVERGLAVVAGAQKVFWTGVLQPAFKAWNVLVKNPILMFRNADGFSGIRPEVWGSVVRQMFNTKKMRQFKKDMLARNMAHENALQTRNVYAATADDIAARAGIISFFARNPAKTLRDAWRGISQVLASVDNAQRYAIATGAYKRAKGLGFNEKQALDIASQAPGKVLGDFDRVTRLMQNLEVVTPYSGATQAGVRAMVRATKTKPISTTAKDAMLLGGMAALAYYSLSNNDEYYKDMIDSGRRYVLDNNWTIVLPGASRDDEGEWSGVLHIPLTPDFRPAMRAVWQSALGLTQGDGLDAKMIAGEAFNQLTGDSGNQLYADERTKHRENLQNGVLPSSPALNLTKTLLGINTFSGDPLADEFIASKPRQEQVIEDRTTSGAMKISNLTKGIITPLQADQLLGHLGTAGDVLQGQEDEPSKTIVQSFTKPLKPGKGLSEQTRGGRAYYDDLEVISGTIKNKDDFRAFQELTTKNSVKTVEDSAARAQKLLARPNVLKAAAELDRRKRARGEAGDPFFGLTAEQQQRVLRYRASKDLNNAKQAYDKNGNPLFMALGLDEKWYTQYRKKEDTYWKQIEDKQKQTLANLQTKIKTAKGDEKKRIEKKIQDLEKSVNDDTILTWSGAQRPDDKKMEALEAQYHKLPKGTGQRSAFIDNHPELLEYWAKGEQFTNAERIAMGLKVYNEDGTASSGSSGNPSDSFDRFGSGGGSRAARLKTAGSAYEYAVSLGAGGGKVTPKIAIKRTSKGRVAKRVAVAKPKVTMKKSLV